MSAALVGLGVLALSLFGIISRPGGDLASFWPANAFLLGMLVRFPQLAHRWVWIAAALGYFLADALTGAPLIKNCMLNLGNLAGVSTGYWIFHSMDRTMHRLQSPSSVLCMLMAIVGASSASGLSGAISNSYLFNDSAMKGFSIWFATELVNYIGFLPLILAIPAREEFPPQPMRWMAQQITPEKIGPALALLLSATLGHMVGGPGAVAFTIPALMWCAVSYSLFTTSFITFWVSTWSLLSIIVHMLTDAHGAINRDLVMSVRLGLSLVMLTPIMIGSVMMTNRELVKRLKVLAERDLLTGLSNRGSFLEASEAELRSQHANAHPCAVLMLDVDHFKSVNDRFGHATGDEVLRQLGDLLRACLRQQDIAGRMGGEEFAVFLPRTGAAEAFAIADRIRERLATTTITVPAIGEAGEALQCTASIGLATDQHSLTTLAALLHRADKHLYLAKQRGRNRVVAAS